MHHHSTENLSNEELLYHDFIRRAEDFIKIEIYRNALECYEFALATGVNNTYVNEQISLLYRKIRKEVKTIRILLAIAAMVVAAVILL